MTDDKSKINCPNCGEEIDVNDILYHQVDQDLKQKYNDDLTLLRKNRSMKYKLPNLLKSGRS